MTWSVFFFLFFFLLFRIMVSFPFDANGSELLVQSFKCIQISEIRLVGILLAIYRRVGSKIKVRPAEIDAVMIPTGGYNVLGTTLSDKVCFLVSV